MPALAALSTSLLTEAIEASDMLGKDIVLDRLDQIAAQYVRNITPPPGH